jgi:phosphate acetyltransferase
MFQDSEIDAITSGDPFGCPPHGKYERLIALAKEVPPATTVVVYPCDETSLRGACEAAESGIIIPVLVGPATKMTAVARQHGIDIARYKLVDARHSEAAAAKAVELIREGSGELLMKGSLHTDELMRAVTSTISVRMAGWALIGLPSFPRSRR